VPNHPHKEIALAAATAGKWITCEKPLAMSSAEGEEMVAAVERAGVPNLVWYNYRRVAAITLAKQLIDEGRIGRPYHYRAQSLQGSTIAPDVP
jgi:predicted dehydrogenase